MSNIRNEIPPQYFSKKLLKNHYTNEIRYYNFFNISTSIQ